MVQSSDYPLINFTDCYVLRRWIIPKVRQLLKKKWVVISDKVKELSLDELMGD
jgi:hypothetical protein